MDPTVCFVQKVSDVGLFLGSLHFIPVIME